MSGNRQGRDVLGEMTLIRRPRYSFSLVEDGEDDQEIVEMRDRTIDGVGVYELSVTSVQSTIDGIKCFQTYHSSRIHLPPRPCLSICVGSWTDRIRTDLKPHISAELNRREIELLTNHHFPTRRRDHRELYGRNFVNPRERVCVCDS